MHMLTKIKKTQDGFIVTFAHGRRFLIPSSKWMEYDIADTMQWFKNEEADLAEDDEDGAAEWNRMIKENDEVAMMEYAIRRAQINFQNNPKRLVDYYHFLEGKTLAELGAVELERIEIDIEDLWSSADLVDD